MQPTSSMVTTQSYLKKNPQKTLVFCVDTHLLCVSGLSVSVPGLEKSLHQYTLEPSEKPFDMKSVPLATAPITEQKTGTSS